PSRSSSAKGSLRPNGYRVECGRARRASKGETSPPLLARRARPRSIARRGLKIRRRSSCVMYCGRLALPRDRFYSILGPREGVVMKRWLWLSVVGFLLPSVQAAAPAPKPLVTGLKYPESVAAAPDGKLYISVMGEPDKDGDGGVMVFDKGKL